MNAFLDDMIVGTLLLLSIGYAAFKLGPKALRASILQTLSRALDAAPSALRLGGLARRLEMASGKNQGACGGCDNCGTQSNPAPRSSADIRVPVDKIGRRAEGGSAATNAAAYRRRYLAAPGAKAPLRLTVPLTVFGSTVISYNLAATSAGTSFWLRP